MKTSEFLKKKLKKPATQIAATLAVVTIGFVAVPNISKSCPPGNLGDCDSVVGGGAACTWGGVWDDCGMPQSN